MGEEAADHSGHLREVTGGDASLVFDADGQR